MKESIKKYFEVGIVSFMAYPSMLRGEAPEIVELLKKIATDDYFDAIEVNWIKDAGKGRKWPSCFKARI